MERTGIEPVTSGLQNHGGPSPLLPGSPDSVLRALVALQRQDAFPARFIFSHWCDSRAVTLRVHNGPSSGP
jgi:hypothetical protein